MYSTSNIQVTTMCILSVKSLQLYLTLCDPRYCSPQGSSIHGILQARILEWVAVSSSRASSWPRIKPVSLMSPAFAGGFFTTSAAWEAPYFKLHHITKSAISGCLLLLTLELCICFKMKEKKHFYASKIKTIKQITFRKGLFLSPHLNLLPSLPFP